jgi:hypothetical protein
METTVTPNLDSFKRDIATHQMLVIRDDGLHRHLRFKRPNTMCMHFDIITWPGHLCYTGDMGTFVFQRLEDMLEFFRQTTDRPYRIDFRYWAEKVQAADKGAGLTEFSPEKFEHAVKTDALRWIRDNAHRTSREERRDLWEAITDEVLHADDDSGGYRKQVAAHDFSHRLNQHTSFHFQDFWDHNVQQYTYGFIWCCFALAWAIAIYDARHATVTTVA